MQNVLLGADGRALVCDFGIAKFKDRTFVSTANGQAGTPAYMAPEMFDGVGITEKVHKNLSVALWARFDPHGTCGEATLVHEVLS